MPRPKIRGARVNPRMVSGKPYEYDDIYAYPKNCCMCANGITCLPGCCAGGPRVYV